MKKYFTAFALLITVFNLKAQDITGRWNGVLKVPGMEMRVVINIEKNGDSYNSTMDSPDQQVKGIAITKTTFIPPKLMLEIATAKIEFEGELKGEVIEGTFKQSGQKFPLQLTRKEIAVKQLNRPQEPKPPFSYYTEEVVFKNEKANIVLAGTLSLPSKDGNFPVVVLITGSGPQTRDEEVVGHKPFYVIADYFTKNGIAVLRYDDRGFGKSTGVFKNSTSYDFATDVESAVSYLRTRKEINVTKIGLVGHSEGGLIAPMVAVNDSNINFIVLMAGTGIRGDKLLLLQQQLIAKSMGTNKNEIKKNEAIIGKAYSIIVQNTDNDKVKQDLTDYAKEVYKEFSPTEKQNVGSEEEFIKNQVAQLMDPWMLYLLRYDPAATLEKVKCPVLAINGEKDLQVPSKINLTTIQQALQKGGNKNVTIKEFAGMNHLFQDTKTGAPSEYIQNEQTISQSVLDMMLEWILKQTK